jgi:integrase
MAFSGSVFGQRLQQSNVTLLEWSQVDLKRKVCWIHPDMAKGGKAIGIPLSDQACDTLKSQSGKHERWVFPYRGSPVAKIKLAWHKACVRTGLGKFTPTRKGQKYNGFVFHGLRHTWASWSIMAGTPIDVLRQLGGWADLQMVLRYAHLAPDHLRQYANNSVPWSVT